MWDEVYTWQLSMFNWQDEQKLNRDQYYKMNETVSTNKKFVVQIFSQHSVHFSKKKSQFSEIELEISRPSQHGQAMHIRLRANAERRRKIRQLFSVFIVFLLTEGEEEGGREQQAAIKRHTHNGHVYESSSICEKHIWESATEKNVRGRRNFEGLWERG